MPGELGTVESAEEDVRGASVSEEHDEREYIQTLWSAVSARPAAVTSSLSGARGGRQQQKQQPQPRRGPPLQPRGGPSDGAMLQGTSLWQPHTQGGNRSTLPSSYAAEQHMARMLTQGKARPRAPATPSRPRDTIHSTRPVAEHPKWATYAVATTFAFIGGALGLNCGVHEKDDEEMELDATRAMNDFFKKSKDLSQHMSHRYAAMMQMLSEKVLLAHGSNPGRGGMPLRGSTTPVKARQPSRSGAGGGMGRYSPAPSLDTAPGLARHSSAGDFYSHSVAVGGSHRFTPGTPHSEGGSVVTAAAAPTYATFSGGHTRSAPSVAFATAGLTSPPSPSGGLRAGDGMLFSPTDPSDMGTESSPYRHSPGSSSPQRQSSVRFS